MLVDEGAVDTNAVRCTAAVEQAAGAGAELVVMPECALTGYQFDSVDDVYAAAIELSDDRLAALATRAGALGVTVVVGLLERRGDVVHNSAAVLGVDGRIDVVRKTHLPRLGADRFVVPGDRIGPVFATPAGRVGIAICYDFRFPETCRALALAGADIVAVPVNWSTQVAVLAEHFVPTRAVENRVFVAVADRVGVVGEFEFLGASRVVGPDGRALAAPADRATGSVSCASVELSHAREKGTVFLPGAFEIDGFADRRPELYQSLTERSSGTPGGTPHA
jgi:predicted amidohydrolase